MNGTWHVILREIVPDNALGFLKDGTKEYQWVKKPECLAKKYESINCLAKQFDSILSLMEYYRDQRKSSLYLWFSDATFIAT